MRKLLVFIYPRMADFEMVLSAFYCQTSEKIEIIPIAYSKDPITAASGLKYLPQYSVDEINEHQQNDEIIGIMIPGGWDIVLEPSLKKLLLKFENDEKLISAICAGPEYLAKAGILKNHKFTTSQTPEAYIEEHRADPFPWNNFTDTRVCVDNNVITSKGHAFVDFALEIWDYLGIYDSDTEKEEMKKEFTPL